jgi:hypothetical protein
VADALGLKSADILASGGPSLPATAQDLPDLPEEEEDPDGRPIGIL